MEYTEFWGSTFSSENVISASRRIISLGREKQAVPVRFINANSIAIAYDDGSYRRVLESPGINYADGLPLTVCLSLIARMAGARRQLRVRGPSLFEEILRQSAGLEVRHLFFGSSEETLEALKREIESRYAGVQVSAYVAPPVASADELTKLATQAHNQFGGDVVWLGLGQPKQDIVAHQLAGAISRPCVGVGAAFEFVAGVVKPAPRWMQGAGLEWLYRLKQEPRRLWRRYSYGNLRFLAVAVAELRAMVATALAQYVRRVKNRR